MAASTPQAGPEPFSLATTAPGRTSRRLADTAILASLLCLGLMAPFSRAPLAAVPAFIPAYESTLAINDLITAILLFSQFARVGRASILVVAAGYLFDALVIVAHGLSFPGVFSPTGWLGATSQTTAWLYVFWHAWFPLSVLAYGVLAGSRWDAVSPGPARRRAVLLGVAGGVAFAAGLTLMSTVWVEHLPVLIVGGDYYRLVSMGVSPAILLVTGLAIAVLWRRRQDSVLDIWLHAVLWVWLCDVALSAVISSSRYDLGWYGGRLFGLAAASFVLGALLVESNALHGRLAASLALAEQRNAELAQSRSELARAQRLEAVGQLTAGVAHDFNNLLTAIMGALDMIRRRPSDQERVAMLAGTAGKAASRGARLVRQLMTFSRQQNLRPEVLDPNAMVREAESFARAGGGTATFIFDLDPATQPVRVDPAEFQAALLNLISNARDAMPGGGEIRFTTSNIDVTTDAPDLTPGAYVRIRVADTGEGMSAETQAKAFEPFYTTKQPGGGTGLGLSQVYGFARSAGGSVTITSAPGCGTAIDLFLPRAIAVRPDDRGTHSLPRAAGQTVLVGEDDPLVMTTTIATLQELGYHTIEAIAADGALGTLTGPAVVDVLFSDVAMPGAMNGAGLATAARRLRPGLPIVLTSGYAGEQAVGRPPDVAVLPKPYCRNDLADALQAALLSRHAAHG